MSGEIGQLQRLTDEQVSARLAAYNGHATLNRDVALLRDKVTDIIAAEIVAQFGSERAERFAANYAGKVDAKWVQGVADYGRQISAIWRSASCANTPAENTNIPLFQS